VVIAGSEGSRNDLPGMFSMESYDFAAGTPRECGDKLHDAMTTFTRGSKPNKYHPMRHFAATKAVDSISSLHSSLHFSVRIDLGSVATHAGIAAGPA